MGVTLIAKTKSKKKIETYIPPTLFEIFFRELKIPVIRETDLLFLPNWRELAEFDPNKQLFKIGGGYFRTHLKPLFKLIQGQQNVEIISLFLHLPLDTSVVANSNKISTKINEPHADPYPHNANKVVIMNFRIGDIRRCRPIDLVGGDRFIPYTLATQREFKENQRRLKLRDIFVAWVESNLDKNSNFQIPKNLTENQAQFFAAQTSKFNLKTKQNQNFSSETIKREWANIPKNDVHFSIRHPKKKKPQ